MPNKAGTLTKPNAITPTAMIVMAARIANCVHTARDKRSMLVRPPAIRSDQRVARGVWARHLTDRAAPLQFEFGEVAFPPRPGEQTAVDPAQGQIDDESDVGEVTTEPIGKGALHPWICRQEVQTPGERRPGVGQLAEHRRDVA